MIPSKHQFDGKKVTVGELGRTQSGGTPSSKHPEYFEGSIPWIGTTALNGKLLNKSDAIKLITEEAITKSSTKLVPQYSIMVGIRVGVGKVAINAVPMCTSQDIVSIVGIDETLWNKEYISLVLQYKAPLLAAQAQGATITGITSKTLKSIAIPAIPLESQNEIVHRLGKIEWQMDSVREQLVKLDSLVKSRFVEMFDGTSFPIKRLEDVAEIQGGLTKNKRRDSLALKLPYLRVANVLKSGIDTSEMKSIGLTEQEYEATKLMKDDLLFVEGNGSSDQIGRSAIWDGEIDFCVHQNHLIRARFGESVLPAFAQAYFSSSAGRDQIISRAVSTSGLMTLSTGKIKSLRIPVPSLELQGSFVDFAAQVDKSRFAGTFTGTINVKNYAISCSVHNNSGRIPNEALHSAREVTECALFELQELYDSLTQKYFAL